MRKITVQLLLLCCVINYAWQEEEKPYVEKYYLEQSDTTYISQFPEFRGTYLPLNRLIIRTFIKYRGKNRPKEKPNVKLLISRMIRQGDDLLFKDNYAVSCYVDDKEITFPKGSYYKRPEKLYTIEFIEIWLPYSIFVKLCEASKLEFRAGIFREIRFEASEWVMEGFKELRRLYEKD